MFCVIGLCLPVAVAETNFFSFMNKSLKLTCAMYYICPFESVELPFGSEAKD